eukprot:TRINITY_DN4433_c0_g1_i2.p1 TRINITY_DN4433_c0_g1~~TRINITY_DN4433_c0_g1_i2.p1  ORF type:complete len:363 (+),score=105.50 TRINITY_DN4433_c0_g1_i2:883-1971(+)
MAQQARQQDDLSTLDSAIHKLESDIKADPAKQKALGLYDELYKLQTRKADLETEMSAAQLSVPDERERLLQKVKVVNAEIVMVEKRTTEALDKITAMKEEITNMDREMKEAKSDKAEKFKELLQRDKEMTTFLDSFEASQKETMEANTTAELTIIGLLEHISRHLASEQAMPTQSALKQMNEDLRFKEQQLEHSQQTSEKLREELRYRKAELEKMTNLDGKIVQETKLLQDRMASMKNEMETVFNSIDKMQEEHESTKKQMLKDKHRLTYRREMLAKQVSQLNQDIEHKKKKLQDSDTHQQLEVLEKSLRHYAQNNYHMQEYILTKGIESDYTQIYQDVLSLVNDLNQLLVQDLATPSSLLA